MADHQTIVDNLETERLRLRRWLPDDLEAFAQMSADPAVMEYLPNLLERSESDALAHRVDAHFEQHGFGMWAIEVPGVSSFVGCVGLMVPTFDAPFMPCVEIAWRLARPYWGRGYATEGARRALRCGFEDFALAEILSFTVPDNVRSRAVMARIGMTRFRDSDFDHPRLPEGHRLARHVLYRLSKEDYFRTVSQNGLSAEPR